MRLRCAGPGSGSRHLEEARIKQYIVSGVFCSQWILFMDDADIERSGCNGFFVAEWTGSSEGKLM
jgi:hypothetical protein